MQVLSISVKNWKQGDGLEKQIGSFFPPLSKTGNIALITVGCHVWFKVEEGITHASKDLTIGGVGFQKPMNNYNVLQVRME